MKYDPAAVMKVADALPPAFRALMHEYGLRIVDAMWAQGYRNADELRDKLETWRERQQRDWLATDYCKRGA